MSVRVYLPMTIPLLAEHVAAGEVPVEVDRFIAAGEDEESEYAALVAAAEESLALLGADPGRRVVVVAEVEDPDGAVPLELVVAVHADADDRPAGANPDEDLGWYASQEIGDLLSG